MSELVKKRRRAAERIDGGDRLHDEKWLAELLGVQPRTTQNWRQQGGGPPYVKLPNRQVRYWEQEVYTWLDQSVKNVKILGWRE